MIIIVFLLLNCENMHISASQLPREIGKVLKIFFFFLNLCQFYEIPKYQIGHFVKILNFFFNR